MRWRNLTASHPTQWWPSNDSPTRICRSRLSVLRLPQNNCGDRVCDNQEKDLLSIFNTATPCAVVNTACEQFYFSNNTDAVQVTMPTYMGQISNWAGFLIELQLTRLCIAWMPFELLENITTAPSIPSFVLGAFDIVQVANSWKTSIWDDEAFANSSWTFRFPAGVQTKFRVLRWSGVNNDVVWLHFDDDEPIVVRYRLVIPYWKIYSPNSKSFCSVF